MFSIVPFAECIARPDEGERKHWLIDHLLAVKAAMENRLQRITDDTVIILLAGLAGVCHDLVKCHREWQKYIRGKRRQGPNHAPEGAFLFSYLGYHWLQSHKRWPEYAQVWLWLARDIADHHGALKSFGDKLWMKNGPWEQLDLPGIAAFLQQSYPDFVVPELSVAVLRQWATQLEDVQDEAAETLDEGRFPETGKLMRRLMFWRELTTALIAGDRFHVAPIIGGSFDQAGHERHDRLIDAFCHSAGEAALTAVRSQAQRQILRQLAADPLRRVYTLEMPTGYGKTITALRLAVWLGRQYNYGKVVYVAPYLSILEQTSSVFEQVLNEPVLEHHSLAVLNDSQKNKPEYEAETAEEEGQLHDGQLVMESWAAPIVCTSFQQFSKALFPGRAQDTLRRAFLTNSVVIIDEPQIFAPESWNVFLHGLEAAAKLYNLRVIFLSATMPPFDYGLSQENRPGRLAVAPAAKVERYQVKQAGKMDEQAIANYMTGYLSEQAISQAVIVNTIADAYLVYQKLAEKVDATTLKLLHGMMAPLHKRVEIEKIKTFHEQEETKEKRLYVVSTQILEAGVDLSFHHIMRALPVLPSIIQAAGRVNRNFSGAIGLLTLMLFLRNGAKNTRGCIYAPFLQKLTDELLQQQEVWQESELLELIKEYYRRMFAHNTYEAGTQAIQAAYEGNWPELGQKFMPFGNEDAYRLPVFVPWQATAEDVAFFPSHFVDLQRRLRLETPEQIYERYADRDYYTGMTFQEKKDFMILMNHYVINVPPDLALSLVGRDAYIEKRIPCLLNKSDYHPVCGLAKRKVEGFDSFI
ncbi:CRISPR-associated helicase/endonuclease Cas3 [Sporomusa acidovorans]|uniref:CRISPR-associated helicase Cas3 n=1 Tax=Sporomusa acidovorans (strain ATCC 49682 / DSM 3132 / Mol) TaxID=1123286 RepID=A0ABZ3IVX0_SPOA4|nr:CRISPR-associated helicase/endonuclease Cas3 [Sporomusa acidovorans]OZC22038.1 helicase Cas3 [Sporomusa acidovorans DSM 3132]SDF70153.1 CRISPR-associated helicase, Cas3 family [Sporomusa acidovorans]